MSSGEFASWLAAVIGALTYIGLVISWVRSRREFPKVVWHVFQLATHTKTQGISTEDNPYFRLSNLGTGTAILVSQHVLGGERIYPENELPETIFTPAKFDHFPIHSDNLSEAWLFIVHRSVSDKRFLYLSCLPLMNQIPDAFDGLNRLEKITTRLKHFYSSRFGNNPVSLGPKGLRQARVRITEKRGPRVDKLCSALGSDIISGRVFL
jgi:hypothetical protein